MFVIKNHWSKECVISVETSPVKKMICFKHKRENHHFYLGLPKLKMYLTYSLHVPCNPYLHGPHRSIIIPYDTSKKPVYMPLSNFNGHAFCMPVFTTKMESDTITKNDIQKFAAKAVDSFYTSAFTGEIYTGLIIQYNCEYFSEDHIKLLNKWQADTKTNKKFRFKASDFDEEKYISLNIEG